MAYAVIAAASPLALTATFIVVRGERPRRNGIAFLAGFVLGTTIACILGRIIGDAAVAKLDSHGTIEGVASLALGAALVGFGIRSHRRRSQPAAPSSSRVSAIMESLCHVRPAAAFSMAGLLGFGGPKRLVLAVLAMAALSSAGHGHFANLTLAVAYIVIATVLVWVPVGMVVVAGERAAIVLGRSESWIGAHATGLRTWLSLGFGTALVTIALFHLVT